MNGLVKILPSQGEILAGVEAPRLVTSWANHMQANAGNESRKNPAMTTGSSLQRHPEAARNRRARISATLYYKIQELQSLII
ncbi:hypothetical protein RJ035_003137, partial [Blastomyces gilchristii]